MADKQPAVVGLAAVHGAAVGIEALGVRVGVAPIHSARATPASPQAREDEGRQVEQPLVGRAPGAKKRALRASAPRNRSRKSRPTS